MFSSFEAFMNKYFTPVANWMDKNVYLSAIKKAMVAMTPILIIGSFCLIPGAIPNMIGPKNPISIWITQNDFYSFYHWDGHDGIVCISYYCLSHGKVVET